MKWHSFSVKQPKFNKFFVAVTNKTVFEVCCFNKYHIEENCCGFNYLIGHECYTKVCLETEMPILFWAYISISNLLKICSKLNCSIPASLKYVNMVSEEYAVDKEDLEELKTGRKWEEQLKRFLKRNSSKSAE